MSDVEEQFHELWLGMVQPIEGLVVSVPVLTQAQCYERGAPSLQQTFIGLCALDKDGELQKPVHVSDTPRFLSELLQLTPDLCDASADYHPSIGWAGTLPQALAYYAAEGGQTITASLGLKKLDSPASGTAETSDVVEAGARYEMLLWELPRSLELDKAETTTGSWHYPPAAKFERLLRAARVPIGLLTNSEIVRLIYAPAGESTGHIDFRVADMGTVGGRPILDAFVMLLRVQRFFGVAAERALPALLAESRKYQANVTVELGKQVLQALTLLLRGFEAAAERDGKAALEAALAREGDHLYQGLLAVLLRLVFVLYAEDRGLLPIDQPLYEKHYSLFALFAQLQAEHGAYPDSMSRRYGAWGRVVALFRALFAGVAAGELRMPARRGHLFDPNTFAFLEGWDPSGSAPIGSPRAQSEVKLPTLDDETMYEVLHRLILLDGQRLSYRALDVEQIGSVYEGLMGYHVKRVGSDAVCMRPDGVWVGANELLEVAPAQRESWLVETVGLPKAQAKTLAGELHGLRSETKVFEVLEGYALGRTKEQRMAARARAGQLVLQPGPERRRTSSHYTPRSLSTQVVERALEPLLKTMTPEGAAGPSSERVLQLRVCDPAMGSGAFLVEACRYLADALEAAWRREGTLSRHRDPTIAARRRVAQCCLYGVDKNAFAVELAKLSLWLVTLEKQRPFTFMDSNLRHGDSLVGLSLDQIRAFHWKPGAQLDLDAQAIGKEIDEAISARLRLQELALNENGVNPDPREKEILLDDAEDALARTKLIADVCIGAFFACDSDKERERERTRRLGLVQRWLSEEDAERGAKLERQLREMVAQLRETQTPFHWMLEFPDVFWGDRPDPLEGGVKNGAAFIDAFVGNPPFMGATLIPERLGDGYIPWLRSLHEGTTGKFDLSAQFLRRLPPLLGRSGTIGMIATNTISQGDTRETGLASSEMDPFKLYGAVTNLPWPGTAGVTITVLHLACGSVVPKVCCSLNGMIVDRINSHLEASSDRPRAQPLRANDNTSYLGCKIGGQGFVIEPKEARRLLQSPRNRDRVRLYIGGEEVNTHPHQEPSRYVIDFESISLDEARQWPELLAIVQRDVKPYRETVNRESWRKRWWQFAEVYPAMRAAIRPLDRCLVTARVTKHLCFSFQPTDRILNEKLYVFPFDHFTAFAVLQSRVHEPWVWLLSSTLETRLNYSASDCFETFPFPKPDPRTQLPALEQAGKALYEARAKYMVANDIGLTKTYNALKDPKNSDREILKLRELHEAMDHAVLDAYGWSDLKVPPFCPKDATAQAALKRFEAEVIDRLYALNAERAAEEERLGIGSQPKASRKGTAAKAPRDTSALKPPAKTRGTKQPNRSGSESKRRATTR